MTPQNVLDAATLIATASATLAILVQLVKFGFSPLSARATVSIAFAGGVVLTLLYGASNALLTLPNAFALAVAAVTIAAAGAGIHSATTAAVTGSSTSSPAPTPPPVPPQP